MRLSLGYDPYFWSLSNVSFTWYNPQKEHKVGILFYQTYWTNRDLKIEDALKKLDLPVFHHQYLATDHYLESSFGADVIVHVGTHGNQEFLPGKSVALSERCYPDIAIGDVHRRLIELLNVYAEVCHFIFDIDGDRDDVRLIKRYS